MAYAELLLWCQDFSSKVDILKSYALIFVYITITLTIFRFFEGPNGGCMKNINISQ